MDQSQDAKIVPKVVSSNSAVETQNYQSKRDRAESVEHSEEWWPEELETSGSNPYDP